MSHYFAQEDNNFIAPAKLDATVTLNKIGLLEDVLAIVTTNTIQYVEKMELLIIMLVKPGVIKLVSTIWLPALINFSLLILFNHTFKEVSVFFLF